mgnify:CR=1 FL=1
MAKLVYNTSMLNTTRTSNTPMTDNTLQRQLLVAFYCVVLLATVAGNSLVCAAIYVDRRLRNHTNWFIASLAVSDLLYGCVSLPFRIAQQAMLQRISIYACGLWIWADMACASASIANLAAISVDRYIKITKPLSYGILMTGRRVSLSIGGVWIYALLLASLSLVDWGRDTNILATPRGACLNTGKKIFYTVAMVVAFLTPLIILVVSYCRVYVTALKHFRKMQRCDAALSLDRTGRRQPGLIFKDFKATKTIAIVIGTFCVCWCPFFILFTVTQYISLNLAPRAETFVLVTFVFVLPNLNSACNPLVYACFCNDFRRAFRYILVKIANKFNATK